MSRFCKVNLKNQTKKDNSSQLFLSLLPRDDDDDVMKLFVCFIDFSTTTRSSPSDVLPSRTYQSCERCEKHTRHTHTHFIFIHRLKPEVSPTLLTH